MKFKKSVSKKETYSFIIDQILETDHSGYKPEGFVINDN